MYEFFWQIIYKSWKLEYQNIQNLYFKLKKVHPQYIYLKVRTAVNIKKFDFWQFFCEIDIQKSKKVGRCGQVGSDKERPKGRVGSGSDNARGSTILNFGAD